MKRKRESIHYCEIGSKPRFRYSHAFNLWIRSCMCRTHAHWPRSITRIPELFP